MVFFIDNMNTTNMKMKDSVGNEEASDLNVVGETLQLEEDR